MADFSGNSIDLRLDGIRTNNNAELSLVAIYGTYSEAADQDFIVNNQKDSGVFFIAEHTQGNFSGGFSKLSFSYATDAMAGIGANGQLRGFAYQENNSEQLKANDYLAESNHGT